MQITKTCETCCLGRQHSANSQSSTFDKNTGTYSNDPLLHNHPLHNYPHRDGWLLQVFGSHCSNKTGTLYNAFLASFPLQIIKPDGGEVWLQYPHLCSSISYKSMTLTQSHQTSPNPPTVPSVTSGPAADPVNVSMPRRHKHLSR